MDVVPEDDTWSYPQHTHAQAPIQPYAYTYTTAYEMQNWGVFYV